MKTKTVKELDSLISKIILETENDIKDDQACEKIYFEVKAILEKYDQKPLGKIFLKELNKSFPDAHLKQGGLSNNVVIPSKIVSEYLGFKTDKDMTIYIPYNNGRAWEFSDLDRCNTCYIEAKHERIKKNKKFLKNKKLILELAKNLLAIKEAHEFLNNEISSYDIPAYYSILEITGVKTEKIKG